jgi:error-prone DNA polymerase
MFERYRRETLGARLLCVTGELQREGLVIHLIAYRMRDLSNRLRALAGEAGMAQPATRIRRLDRAALHRAYPSRDFH